jgi:hypothetical protein
MPGKRGASSSFSDDVAVSVGSLLDCAGHNIEKLVTLAHGRLQIHRQQALVTAVGLDPAFDGRCGGPEIRQGYVVGAYWSGRQLEIPENSPNSAVRVVPTVYYVIAAKQRWGIYARVIQGQLQGLFFFLSVGPFLVRIVFSAEFVDKVVSTLFALLSFSAVKLLAFMASIWVFARASIPFRHFSW